MNPADPRFFDDVFDIWGARLIRAAIFGVVTMFLLWLSPYNHPNSFFTAIVISMFSTINMGAKAASFAIAALFVVANVPPELIAALQP